LIVHVLGRVGPLGGGPVDEYIAYFFPGSDVASGIVCDRDHFVLPGGNHTWLCLGLFIQKKGIVLAVGIGISGRPLLCLTQGLGHLNNISHLILWVLRVVIDVVGGVLVLTIYEAHIRKLKVVAVLKALV
jgi:hypothetical protein